MSKGKLIIVGGILAIVGLIVVGPKALLYLAGSHKSTNTQSQAFYISGSVDLTELANQLMDEKIIDNVKSFVSVGEYKELTNKSIASGKYLIEPGTNYRTLLNGFTKNSNGNGNAEVEVEVTFNNCRDIYQMAGKVSKCIDVDSTKLIAFLQSGATLSKLGFSVEQLPALFIPDSYQMYWDSNEEVFVDRMAQEFKNFWTSERKNSLSKIGLNSPSQATFKFCWGDQLKGVQRLLEVHRNIDCPYNTYKINGLPPGPICLPSPKVVDAVLNRADVDYIYMCAKPDYSGRHNFAVSGAEHMRNADAFQSWLAAELRKKN
jgi:UPF0755 protein